MDIKETRKALSLAVKNYKNNPTVENEQKTRHFYSELAYLLVGQSIANHLPRLTPDRRRDLAQRLTRGLE